jgi:hypothetical protein
MWTGVMSTGNRPIFTGENALFWPHHAPDPSNTVHFGLGATDRVDGVEIRWPNGQALTLRRPAVNRYHWIRAPVDNPARP